jgi:hypothetical protein
MAAGMASIRFDVDLVGSSAATGQRAGFVLFAGFLLSFAFIRFSTRMIRAQVSWWPGNIETKGGLHIHHLVFGIVLLMVSGFLAFALAPGSPWLEILAGLFGIGAGLTIDEFALWLHLEDVYWKEQGRQSVDAAIFACLFAGLMMLGLTPFDVHEAGSTAGLVAVLCLHLGTALITIAKGKIILGLVGVFIPGVSLVTAIRLAKPGSPWARRRYRDKPEKLAEARARAERMRARQDRLTDLIGGKPEPDAPPAAPQEPDRPVAGPS